MSTLARDVAASLAREDGALLARALSLQTGNTRRKLATVADPSFPVVQTLVRAAQLPAPWDDMIAHFICAGALLFGPSTKTRKPVESWHLAAEALQASASVFLRLFAALSPGRWAIPVLVSLLRDLRWTAKCADDAAHAVARDARRTNPHMEECARTLNRGFSACVADRYPSMAQSKKWGTYAMVNLVFRTYFQLHSISLCKNILRALGAGDLPPLEAFPKAHVVTFRYYVGRLALLEEDYGRAEAELSQALALAPRSSTAHIERILVYLIPIRLLQGQQLAPAWLAEFPRVAQLYAPFLRACQRGDVRAYDEALRDSAVERALVHLGVYLAMERARDVCVTRLLRRVWALSGRGTRQRLAPMAAALQWLGAADDADGAEWLVATQMARGRVKGYIAHERQMLVLSASEPFPHASLAML
ncbi:Similar to S.cerevisiae protein YJR084W (Protein that forms a complex with Thp3p) [Malassezia sympodialis ATCC 42132]|uniref:Similar to S.cerevisiae protein YJR084W (Protein that forms a complex with Thp3p) n=1 Tax=Malassezia sympodialis (strain ATCC 42132) TaxID=1230383 RepID=A0A1M8A4V8_MALS4|nr:Similar to S.cerevisiae protein YJR084W (Protein that forms a complex with Thp3p) [Malassezia sympodialis ATCC 42132]